MSVERGTPLKVFLLVGLIFMALAMWTNRPIFLILSLWMALSAVIYFFKSY